MKRIFIADAKRTAVGSFQGALSKTPATDFAAEVVKDILKTTGVPADKVTELICGNVLTAAEGQGPGRQVAIKAGLPNAVPAYSLNMVCGSGMKAIINGVVGTAFGLGNLVIAGGTENMSIAPYLLDGARAGYRMGNKEVIDHMVYDSLTDAYQKVHMGITAENVAAKYGITRQEQDAFALKSQEKAIAAVDGGKFKNEIVPIIVKQGKATVAFDTDEYPNRTTNAEKLAGLRPAFKPDGGTVTAGNASGINDGAAFVLLADEEAVAKYGLKPMAEVIGFGQGGVDPSTMGLGPVPAIREALKYTALKLSDMDVIELNEAFAAQALGVVTELSAEHGMTKEEILAKSNINGGAIALGHPVGASGARIVVTLGHILAGGDYRYGLASLCIGGGMGTAVVLKKVHNA
ncbi:MAG: acetyl-CoA C-acetyltransferase [Lachnospiraceae bacterium]|nr:acetyl-CoA C-acetyltransferase [Lachnospiraceae bacterium]